MEEPTFICGHCGLVLPLAEAVMVGGRPMCPDSDNEPDEPHDL